jgi:sulfate adenylyltransferase
VPENPEMTIDTQDITPDQAAHKVLVKLESMGFLK